MSLVYEINKLERDVDDIQERANEILEKIHRDKEAYESMEYFIESVQDARRELYNVADIVRKFFSKEKT